MDDGSIDGMPLTLGSPEGSIEGWTLVDGSALNDGDDDGSHDGEDEGDVDGV